MARPREFDAEQALEQAMQLFWRHGYEGTSLSDLTAAMGVSPPSLYAAFGNKAGLFGKALDRYQAGPAAYQQDALTEPTARGVVERLLRAGADVLGDPSHPPGCLLVQAALSCGPGAEAVRQELVARRAALKAALRQRLARGQRDGDLRADADPALLASYIVTVIQGMVVQAVGGAGRKQLREVAAMALRAIWSSETAHPAAISERQIPGALAPSALEESVPPAPAAPQVPMRPLSLRRLGDKPKERRPSALSEALRMAAAMRDETAARRRKE